MEAGPSYRRRDGTAGNSGQLYESNLLGLLLLRLQRLHRHGRVTRFRLATNMAGAGAFDDICLELDVASRERPVALFVQLKHKDNDRQSLKLDNEGDVVKWFNSVLTINKTIASQRSSGGRVTKDDFLCIVYTNAGFAVDRNIEFGSDYATVLNDVLATSDTPGFRPHFSARHLQELEDTILEADLLSLAKRFVTFLNVKKKKNIPKSMSIMLDERILHYHVLLKQRVVDVTKIQTDPTLDLEWRNLTFQNSFYDTDDKHMVLFRNHLYKEILGQYPSTRHNSVASQCRPKSVKELIKSFLSDPSVATLTPLIITHIGWKENDKLEFLIPRPSRDIEKLREISTSMPWNAIAEAMVAATTAAEKYLRSLEVQVPITFGNVDLTVRDSDRLEYLTTAFVDLCNVYEPKEPYKIVTLDDSMHNGLVSPNGGVGGAFGNILNYDAKTKMLQFCNDFASLPNNAKTLLKKLRKKIENLDEYRFDVKSTRLPKLHIAHGCTNVIKKFLSKLVVFANQKNHFEVIEILKKEVQVRLRDNPPSLFINSDSLFFNYDNRIQEKWMSPKTGDTEYVTEMSDLYEQAVNDLTQIALQTTFYTNNVKYCGLSFVENATKWMELPELPSTMFIVTDTVTLTTMKVTQCLQNHYAINKYAVLDLEHILKFPKADFSSLVKLKKTENVVIIVCNTRPNSTSCIKLYELTQSAKEKNIIVIANNAFIEKINEWFPSTNDVFEDKTQLLTTLTPTSQSEVRQNAKVMFQGRELGLNSILDETSVAFIKGGVLDTLIRNETLHVGTTLSNSRYEEFKYLYLDRRMRPVGKAYDNNASDRDKVLTFHDINDDVVLITAAPGMGKSTLLTHLALNTSNLDVGVWIVRVNFIEHSELFNKWCEENKTVDPVESLTFLCQVAVRNKDMSISITISDDEARLVNCTGDDLDAFELNMFLHFYNQRRVIFVFDGFDEICPYYNDKVIDLIDVAKNSLRKSKMWVSSRPYSDIMPALERVVGRRFELEPFTDSEQDAYLKDYWSKNIIYENLKSERHRNLLDIICNTGLGARSQRCEWMRRSCDKFYVFLYQHLHDKNEQTSGMHRSCEDVLERHYYVSGIPLLLYFVADYFVNIANIDDNHIKSKLDLNSDKMYEVFIENKIKKILLQDKNNMNLCNPITRGILEKEVARCVSVHKRLAAYAVLQTRIFEAMDIEEFKEMNPLHAGEDDLKALLNDIKTGKDKIGLVSHVTPGGVPVFIHRTFTDYFAAGYVCDILKSNRFHSNQKLLFYIAILEKCFLGFHEWMYIKHTLDDELKNAIREIETKEPRPLVTTQYPHIINPCYFSRSQLLRINCSSTEDYDGDFFDKYFTKGSGIFTKDGVRCHCVKDVLRDLISSMKPHLKKHFPEACPSTSAVRADCTEYRFGPSGFLIAQEMYGQRYIELGE